MKNLLTVMLLTTFTSAIIAQSYHAFPDSNAIWAVDSVKFTVLGDTLINSNTYKKYYIQMGDTIFDFSKCTYFAAVREDTKKIYAVAASDSIEKLIYNFSIDTGNEIVVYSLFNYMFIDSFLVKAIAIDSVLLNSEYRKRFKVVGVNSSIIIDEYWIEGIGSTNGVFSPGVTSYVILDAYYPSLICFEFESILLYGNYPCFNIPLISEKYTEQNSVIKVYPNPTDNVCNVEFPRENHSFVRAELYDNLNCLIKCYDCYKKNNFIISLNAICKGIYILKFISNENKNAYIRIVVM